jgi:TorA maturation chaperone TorD
MEILRALGTLIEPPVDEHGELADLLELGDRPPSSAYENIFLFQLYPYASVYLGPEGMLGGEARDRIAGFWRVLEETPPPECDHLALMLALYARLCDEHNGAESEQARAFWSNARRAFFWEHLASWLPVYLDKLEQIADPYYCHWGELLRGALEDEAQSHEHQESLSLHLREAPELDDPRGSSGEDFLESLLAPVLSGMILIRSDLERAARELGLGSRLGERKFVLKALFAQDAEATLRWLESEAVRWEEIHLERPAVWEAISTFWSSRAAHSAELLAALKEDVRS